MVLEDKNTNEPKCPACGKSCHPISFEGAGNNKRGGIRGNIIIGIKEINGIDINPIDHFFCRPGNKRSVPKEQCKSVPDAVEGHHLITCEAVDDDDWEKLFDYFSYDINCAENGVLFPGDMQAACHYKVPLHKGNHKATIVAFSDDGADLTVYRNYVDSVGDKLKKLKKKAEECCEQEDGDKQFLDKAKEISEEILNLLVDFTWIITADGKDYDNGGVGCFNQTSIRRKRAAMMKLINAQDMENIDNKAQLHEADILRLPWCFWRTMCRWRMSPKFSATPIRG